MLKAGNTTVKVANGVEKLDREDPPEVDVDELAAQLDETIQAAAKNQGTPKWMPLVSMGMQAAQGFAQAFIDKHKTQQQTAPQPQPQHFVIHSKRVKGEAVPNRGEADPPHLSSDGHREETRKKKVTGRKAKESDELALQVAAMRERLLHAEKTAHESQSFAERMKSQAVREHQPDEV